MLLPLELLDCAPEYGVAICRAFGFSVIALSDAVVRALLASLC